MVNVGLSFSSIIGVALFLLGIALPILGAQFRRPFRLQNLIQDLLIGLIYVIVGAILFFQGWRQDPILQFSQFLLLTTVFYWVLKDIFRRS